ncbi:7-carboxy-7-deazaguanine synthase [hydrothermal vent metagenome]|uniref:7-carboxy-7-deazaguanine synthase n=1 Tax=hydrothermal vent metagenome TaxID=652676 RepID=A0A3B1CFL0_9ZZZZ
MSFVEVWEIFSSIQGESTFAGLPCVFVRLSGCNLSCDYCDTQDAATGTGERMSVDDIVSKVKKYKIPLVEVTGGEPLLQVGVLELLEKLNDAGLKILVETNGSVKIEKFDRRARYIVDIKTPGSGEGGSFDDRNFATLSARDEVKFVITSKADFEWAVAICKKYRLTEKTAVLFSPAYGKVELVDLAGWIMSSNLPVRLNLQLHKYIFGPDAKGV